MPASNVLCASVHLCGLGLTTQGRQMDMPYGMK